MPDLLPCECIKGVPEEDKLNNIYCALYTLVQGGGGGGGNVTAGAALTAGRVIVGAGGSAIAASDVAISGTDISATGAGANVDLNLGSKGAGKVVIFNGVLDATGSGADIGNLTFDSIGPGGDPPVADNTYAFPVSVTTVNGVLTAVTASNGLPLNGALAADGNFTGITIEGTAGATLAFGDLIYLAVADSRWELTDADSVTTAGAVFTGMCVLAAAGDGSATRILLQGTIRADANFPALTVGAPVYASTTPGDIQVAQPSGTDDVIQVVGFALTADSIYFNPSQDYLTHT